MHDMAMNGIANESSGDELQLSVGDRQCLAPQARAAVNIRFELKTDLPLHAKQTHSLVALFAITARLGVTSTTQLAA